MNPTKTALVSIIITTYHNEIYLPRAIESCLHQSYPEIEIIVVDDNPPDSLARAATEKIMHGYPQVTYLKHPENRNGAAARNTGIRAAKGNYIAFLDNDDLYFSDHIAACVTALETHPECGCVLCDVVKICRGLCWDRIQASEGDLIRNLLFSETALGTGSNLFVRAELVHELQGFDESFLRHQDLEFGLRLFSITQGYCLRNVQIVKEMDGYSNAPDFDKFLNTKKQLWKKFDITISSLSEEEKRRYFAGQYSALLYAACKENSRQKIEWTVSRLEQYRKLNLKEKLLVYLSRYHVFAGYEMVKKVMKSIKSPRLYKNIVKELTVYDRTVFDQTLLKREG